MGLMTRMRRQRAVYWERSASHDKYGAFSFASPVEISCRWDGASKEYRDTKGETQLSESTVYPDRVMKAGDRLREGGMESDTPENPMEDADSCEVQRFDTIPNLKATETLYVAYL